MSDTGTITAPCGTILSVKMLAGQDIDAGLITVANDADRICITFKGRNGWYLTESHLAIGKTLEEIPQTKKGNPIPGQFPYARNYDPPVISDSYCFNLSDLGIVPGNVIYIAAHAVVEKALDNGEILNETAWGEGSGFTGKNWATYFMYTVQECNGTPGGGNDVCETAFAFGDKTFQQIAAADPESFPNGVGNRWGWQITVNADELQHTKDIYAGAAQNDITKGTLVGTLNYTYNGNTLTLEYNVLEGFVMHETHVYAGVEDTNTIAPGQYGHIHEFTSDVTSDSYSIPIASQTIYVIAHAVVCVKS